jgi:hypothetical protein
MATESGFVVTPQRPPIRNCDEPPTGPIRLWFDDTEALPAAVVAGRRIFIAAWLFLPDDPAKLGEQPITMTLLSGGSYDKRYY